VGRKALRLTREFLPDLPFSLMMSSRRLSAQLGGFSKEDVSHRDGLDWVDPVLIGCITYQYSRNFQTRIAYDVAALKSRGIVLGTALNSEQIRFIRDDHYEYAQ
jgi:hypothetical protein